MSVSLLCRAEISTSSALYPNGCFQLMGSIDPALAASANCSATGNKSIQDPWARQGGPGAETLPVEADMMIEQVYNWLR